MAFISFTKTRGSLTIHIKIPLIHKYSGGGVALFQERNGEICVLLGRRINAPFARRWTFPGGGQEFTETLFQTGLREFREETGCQLLGRYISRIGYLHIKKPLFRWQTTLVESTQEINPVQNVWTKNYGGEFSEMLWVPISSLGKYRLHPFVKKAIKAYLKKGVMKKYTPKKNSKKTYKSYTSQKSSYSKNKSWVQAPEFASKPRTYLTRRVENDYSMRLVKVDKDGTKYFEPIYKNVVAKSGR